MQLAGDSLGHNSHAVSAQAAGSDVTEACEVAPGKQGIFER
jgi:hypothetical protein